MVTIPTRSEARSWKRRLGCTTLLGVIAAISLQTPYRAIALPVRCFGGLWTERTARRTRRRENPARGGRLRGGRGPRSRGTVLARPPRARDPYALRARRRVAHGGAARLHVQLERRARLRCRRPARGLDAELPLVQEAAGASSARGASGRAGW